MAVDPGTGLVPDLAPDSVPEWYRPVPRAVAVADRAQRIWKPLFGAGWAIVVAGVVGSFLRSFSPKQGDDILTLQLDWNRDALGIFLTRAAQLSIFGLLVVAMAVWVRAAAAQLQVDAARARNAANGDPAA